ncbi:DUF2493 domain-containing protein [Sphingomonas histidinilytica]|uniref:DUF2493 domain-containing protein n=1 Tax=Rhizorhabdus histidinilytica TaxID=439228 RepID=UPI001AD98159|nr:DUF2493 domain-containing protein [Rhizorhabdus histidinilytica]MBO9380816.1 DUF2493 domain-containing protein [Rhizorhabdus histidinilytica]
MRVLVCGGRDYGDVGNVWSQLDTLHNLPHRFGGEGPITEVIHGGAAGADSLANSWASSNRLPVQIFRADWKRFGNRAGPIRNQRMLDEGKPDLVVAFPGGRGTADMVRRAKAAGVRVIEIDDRLNGEAG